MTNSEKKKIIKQIERLCEKQYRKGFQQGFYACDNSEMTKAQVDKFRCTGENQGYLNVLHPHTGRKENAKDRLMSEMGNMEELSDFLNSLSD